MESVGMRIAALVLALGAIFFAPDARPAVFCATSSAGFEFVLAAAEGNGEHDTIRLATGTYNAPPGGFRYFAGTNEDFDLTVSGGWSEFFGNACGQQLEGSPATTINGQLTDRGLEVKLNDSGTLRISRLSFINGFVNDPQRGGGLWIRAETGYAGSIFIERNLFFNNQARYGGGLKLGISGSGLVQVHVVNNLFRLNRARQSGGAAELVLNGGTGITLGARLNVVNNTIVNNLVDTSDADSIGGIFVSGTVPSKHIVNNNLWGNQGLDLRVNRSSSNFFALWHNNFETSLFPSPPNSDFGNVSIQPVYESCLGFLCFSGVPLPNTPLHDGGLEPGMISAWSPGTADYRGLARIHDDTVDIGSFESHSRLFSDRFEP